MFGLFIPWRTSSGFHHGSGSPIPVVIWERIESGSYIDFPVPAALVINPIVIFVLGALSWCAALLLRKFPVIEKLQHDKGHAKMEDAFGRATAAKRPPPPKED